MYVQLLDCKDKYGVPWASPWFSKNKFLIKTSLVKNTLHSDCITKILVIIRVPYCMHKIMIGFHFLAISIKLICICQLILCIWLKSGRHIGNTQWNEQLQCRIYFIRYVFRLNNWNDFVKFVPWFNNVRSLKKLPSGHIHFITALFIYTI